MKNSNLSISNLTNKRSEAADKVATETATEIATEVEPKIHTRVEPTRVLTKVAKVAKVAKVPAKNLPNYTPKIRQQVISNKLLNSKLYELYTVRKLYCAGAWLKANIVDGTITIAEQTYIVAWLDVLPIDAYKEEAVVVSLRSPKYKDSISKEYSLAYAVVSKLSNQ